MAPDPQQNGQDPKIGEAVQQVTERLSLLFREEIELAKAEVETKVKSLVRGAVIGAAAGIFVVVGLLFLLHSGAWGLADLFGDVALGYLVMAIILFVVGGIAGYLGSKVFK